MSEVAQKAKIKWFVEGNENTKCFHGMLNKKRNQRSIWGIMVNGTWIDDPVKRDDLERMVKKEEVKKAVWDCGSDKSPGPDVNVIVDLVNEVQSAFVVERQILDGPFILNEKRDEGGGGVNGGGKATAKVVVVLRRLLAEEVTMVSAVKRGGSGDGEKGRVRESDMMVRIDREVGILFGFAEKIPSKKFSGGGVVAAAGGRPAVAAAGGESTSEECVCVLKWNESKMIKPSRSVTKETSRSVLKELTRSVPKEPSRSVLEEPTRSVPKEPSRSVLEEPSRSVPKDPSRSVPEEPSRSVPKIRFRSVLPSNFRSVILWRY
nr:RNA-directed DNA polymerase, eukaryota [Tanacetum cinerariifolium]